MSEPVNHQPTDDSETAALDEAWAALGQMLAAAEMPLDEKKLVERVCERLEGRRRARRRRVAAFALAATLLAAITLAWPRERSSMRVIAARPQPDFAWHDELEDEIVVAQSDFSSVEAEMYASFEPADWLQDNVEVLQFEMDRSPL